jgi:hypothetical protein
VTGFESEPQRISEVSRYYNDVLYAENQSINLYLTLERLLNVLPFTADLSAANLYDNEFMEHQLSTEPRIAKERMALLPFFHIGPLLEASNVPVDSVKQWYDDAVTGVSWLIDEEHDVDCLEYADGTLQHVACSTSAICPKRFLERYLSDGVYLPDFQSDMYADRAERAITIARDKLDIGIKHDVLQSDSSERAWANYCIDYDNHIYAMLSFPSHGIDKNRPQ